MELFANTYVVMLLVLTKLGVVYGNDDLDTKEVPHINGQNVAISDYPFVCLMTVNGNFRCTCSFVADNRVVTAAHCVRNANIEDITIFLGLQNKANIATEITAGDAIAVDVKRVKLHPNFSFYTWLNDIAVLYLSRSIEFTDRIQIVDRLALPFEQFVFNSKCFIVGYGAIDITGDGESVPGTVLQATNIHVLPNFWCVLLRPPVKASHICVHKIKTRQASWIGDGGGPLVCRVFGKWVLAGVMSFETETCSYPSVYTRVSTFRLFLIKNGIL